jgi:hypothetical protein
MYLPLESVWRMTTLQNDLTPCDILATTEPIDTRLMADDAVERRQLRDRHHTMLWISLAIFVAAFLLRERGTGQVGFAGWPQWNLPALCGSRTLFNIECPGCGLTRSFVALAAGDWRASLSANRVGWLVALAVVLQIPYRWYALRELRTKIAMRTWPLWCGYMLIVALVVNWLLRISGIY